MANTHSWMGYDYCNKTQNRRSDADYLIMGPDRASIIEFCGGCGVREGCNARRCSLWCRFEPFLEYAHVLKSIFVRLMLVADCEFAIAHWCVTLITPIPPATATSTSWPYSRCVLVNNGERQSSFRVKILPKPISLGEKIAYKHVQSDQAMSKTRSLLIADQITSGIGWDIQGHD